MIVREVNAESAKAAETLRAFDVLHLFFIPFLLRALSGIYLEGQSQTIETKEWIVFDSISSPQGVSAALSELCVKIRDSALPGARELNGFRIIHIGKNSSAPSGSYHGLVAAPLHPQLHSVAPLERMAMMF